MFSLVMLITLITTGVIGIQGQKTRRTAHQNLPETQECLWDDQLLAAVQTLSSAQTHEEHQRAVTLLKANAKRSTACRKKVVTSLISVMDQPNLDLTGGTPQFFLWHYGTRLLGELKAVE